MLRPRVLLVYEFGSGLGHLNRLIAVARVLAETADCVFAVPDLSLAAPLLERAFGTTASMHQGAFWEAPRNPEARRISTHTLADVLALFDFAEPSLLARKLDQWRSVLNNVRPDLIVADFAPTLRLATQGRVPTVVVGNGYTVPPSKCLLPPLRPWQDEVPTESRATEQVILENVNRIGRAEGQKPIEFLSDLFNGEQTFVCTLTEFDPYARRRNGPVTWPFNVPAIEPGPAVHARTGPEIFVYMAASHPTFSSLLSALNSLGRPTHMFVTDLSASAVASRCRRHIAVLQRPADFAIVLPETRLLIHHAGLGTAYAGLLAGTPQFVLPLNLEHLITARSLIEMGVAQGFSANVSPTPDQLLSTQGSLLEHDRFIDNARHTARAVKARRDPHPTTAVLDACRSYLDARPH